MARVPTSSILRVGKAGTLTTPLRALRGGTELANFAPSVVAPANTVAPAVSGGTTPGSTLTSTTGTWTGTTPITYTTRWQRSTDGGTTWTVISGATTLTYVTTGETVGSLIRVQRQASNSAGTTAWISANVVNVTAAAVAPTNTAAPVIAGGTTVGSTLTHSGDTWTGSPTYTYQWQRSANGTTWTAISGATSASYTLVSADAGNQVRLQKTGANGTAPNAVAVSNAINVTAASSAIAGTLTNPPISARLGIINGNSARPFINSFKQAWEWEGNNTGGNWAALLSAGRITAGGQIVSMPTGSGAGIRTRVLDSLPAETGATGRWRLTWTGAGTFDLYGTSNETQVNANTIEFDYTANGGNFVTVVARSAPISNIALVHQSDWADHAAGKIFRQQYLDEVRNYRCLRFDEWTGILRDEPYGLAVTTWASRPLPTDEVFTNRFVPYEWMAALCNAVGADMWVCIPTAADDNHIQQAATLIRSLMPAPRHVYVEYSTKTWDFAGTPQAHYCAEQGRIAFGTTANPTNLEFRNWYGMRSAQTAQWWKAVWTGESASRLHTVIQHQCDWVGGEYDVLVAPMWQSRSGQNGLPTYVAPHSVCDMLTVHGQVDGGMAYGAHASEIETWRTTLTQTVAFNRLRDQMLDGRYFDTSDEGQRNISRLTPKWEYYRDVADTYGMELGCYEVGNHLNGVGANTAFLASFSASSQIATIYSNTFTALRAAGFDGPLCMSVECRWPDDNIQHGLQRYLGDHNAAWTAVNAINVVNDGPNDRGTSDFVGSIEVST